MTYKPITLDRILRFDNPQEIKIKFNRHPADPSKPALDLMLSNDREWQEMNCYKGEPKDSNNNMGGRSLLLTFAQAPKLGGEYYMFGGLYLMHDTRPDEYDTLAYEWKPMGLYSEFKARLIVRLDKPLGRRDMFNYEKVQELLAPEVVQILEPYGRI